MSLSLTFAAAAECSSVQSVVRFSRAKKRAVAGRMKMRGSGGVKPPVCTVRSVSAKFKLCKKYFCNCYFIAFCQQSYRNCDT